MIMKYLPRVRIQWREGSSRPSVETVPTTDKNVRSEEYISWSEAMDLVESSRNEGYDAGWESGYGAGSCEHGVDE